LLLDSRYSPGSCSEIQIILPTTPIVAKFPEPRSTLQTQLEQHNTKFLTQLSTWQYSMNHTTECRVHNHRWPHSTKFT